MFCIKYNRKKYCVDKKPLMNAKTIVEIQLKEMKNNKYNSGIKKAYYFASPDNRNSTGPFHEFKLMVKNKIYNNLLNFQSFKIIKENKSKNNMFYSCLVEIKKNNNIFYYEFNLSRQYDFINNLPLYDDYADMDLLLYWRTDSVLLVDKKIKYKKKINIEKFTANKLVNVLGSEMEICSLNPKTGFYRDGYCNTGPEDSGTHVVCANMTEDFLKYTKSKGNDLSTPQGNSFPGLKPGDNWCLCALRWKEAFNEGKAPPVNLRSTNKKALNYITLEELKSV
mgnify:CR=1 FL=1